MSDQNGVSLVITDVTVVRRLGVVIERHQPALRVEPAAHLERERRTFGVPGRFFVPHPLHPYRPADLFRKICRLESRIVRRRPPVALGAFHPDHADLIAGHAEKLCDPIPHAVGLHVVGVDGHLAVRRIGKGVRRREGRVTLERDVVLRFDDRRRASQRRVGIAFHGRPLF